jgi:riboflavin biosynthesis pyrimidine reductase
LYTQIAFPEPPEERPYLFLNMVSTADGKIILGEVGGSAAGVGGPTDQLLFRRLQKVADATMIGSRTLRASHVLYPKEKPRFAVTQSGDVPLGNRFFTDAPDRAYILAPEDLPEDARTRLSGSNLLLFGTGEVDLPAAMRYLRQDLGIRHLLCEGGATLNDDLLRAGLADELFLTLTPKLKGGAHLPTPVEGKGFPPGQFLPLTLLSLYRDGSEIYLRYRIEK